MNVPTTEKKVFIKFDPKNNIPILFPVKIIITNNSFNSEYYTFYYNSLGIYLGSRVSFQRSLEDNKSP